MPVDVSVALRRIGVLGTTRPHARGTGAGILPTGRCSPTRAAPSTSPARRWSLRSDSPSAPCRANAAAKAPTRAPRTPLENCDLQRRRLPDLRDGAILMVASGSCRRGKVAARGGEELAVEAPVSDEDGSCLSLLLVNLGLTNKSAARKGEIIYNRPTGGLKAWLTAANVSARWIRRQDCRVTKRLATRSSMCRGKCLMSFCATHELDRQECWISEKQFPAAVRR